jgi:ribosomal protein L16/L10AE
MDHLPVDISLLDEENENAIKEDVNEDIGFAAAALAGSSSGNYATATLNVEIVANNVFTWIENAVEELNKCLNYSVIRDGSYRIEFRVLPITFLNRDKMVKYFADLYARGKGSLMAWVAAVGVNAEDYISLMDYELEEDYENKYPVHKTSFTITGRDAPEYEDVDGNPGNPSTESTVANNGNSSPAPSDG